MNKRLLCMAVLMFLQTGAAFAAERPAADPAVEDPDFYPETFKPRGKNKIESTDVVFNQALDSLLKHGGEGFKSLSLSAESVEKLRKTFKDYLLEPAYDRSIKVPQVFPAFTQGMLIEVVHPNPERENKEIRDGTRIRSQDGRRWIEAPDSKRGYQLDVHVTPRNIPKLIAYFSIGQQVADLKARVYPQILKSMKVDTAGLTSAQLEEKVKALTSADLKDKFVDVEYFLPEFPRAQINRYAENSPYAQETPLGPFVNCYGSAQQFFKGKYPLQWDFPEELTAAYQKGRARQASDFCMAAQVFSSGQYLESLISQQYCEVDVKSVEQTDFQFGDIVMDARGHAARVILKDHWNTLWIFDKPSGSDEPWTIRPFTEAFAPFPNRTYGFGAIQFFRRCK